MSQKPVKMELLHDVPFHVMEIVGRLLLIFDSEKESSFKVLIILRSDSHLGWSGSTSFVERMEGRLIQMQEVRWSLTRNVRNIL